MRKLIAFLLTAIMVLPILSSCKGTGKAPLEAFKEHVYDAQNISLPDSFNIVQIKFMNESFAFLNEQNIVELDYEGNLKNEINHENYYMNFDINSEENYWAIACEYKEENDQFSITSLSIDKLDKDGKKLEQIKVNTEFLDKNEENIFIKGFMVDDEGNYYLQSNYVVYVLDHAGNYLFDVSSSENEKADMQSLFRMKDGRIASSSCGYRNTTNSWFIVIHVFDPASKSTEEYEIITNDSSYDCTISAGVEYDIMMSTNMGIYEYLLGSEKKTALMNCLDYGLDVKRIVNYALLPNGDIVCALGENKYSGINEIIRYIKTDKAQLAEKKTITIAALEVDYWLKTYIANFNKSNKEYKIDIISYIEGTSGTESDIEDAIKRFNLDLMAGNIPDIIMFNYLQSPQTYIKKGLLSNLYEFMDGDPDFNKEDYLVNAIESLEQDGKLYEIFPMYTVNTLTAKTSDVGEQYGWTLDEFEEFIDSKPDSAYIIGEWSKRDFICRMVKTQFIDQKTGECHFNREDFEKILKIAERFPSNDFNEDIDYIEFLMGSKTGDPIMIRQNLNRFSSIKEQETAFYGEPLTYKGFPSPDGTGSYFLPCATFGIANQAKNPEGAWSFIKFMMDEYKDEYNIYFPIKHSYLQKLMDNVKKEGTTISMSANKKTIDIKIDANTDDDNAKVMELLKSIIYTYNTDSTISEIIDEEIGSYLSEQKSATEVADIIENRINLYINETGD